MGSCLILRFINMFTAELRCQRNSNEKIQLVFAQHFPAPTQQAPVLAVTQMKVFEFSPCAHGRVVFGLFRKMDRLRSQTAAFGDLCVSSVALMFMSEFLLAMQSPTKQHETPNISFPPSPLKPSLLQIWPPWPDHLFWWGQPGVHSTLIVCWGKGEIGSLSINGFEYHPYISLPF